MDGTGRSVELGERCPVVDAQRQGRAERERDRSTLRLEAVVHEAEMRLGPAVLHPG
jgi:hypothetical protein